MSTKSNYNREAQKRYRQNNKEKIAQLKKDWVERNRVQYNQYFTKRRKLDIEFKISHYLRKRLSNLVKNGSHIEYLGCSVHDFKVYLESKFQPGMTWNNYGEWHIDHIRPLSTFVLSNEDELKQACHYSNLQPLWAIDNLEKSDKWH